jgi:hypothetical protein
MMSDFMLSAAYFFLIMSIFYILERKNGKCPYKYSNPKVFLLTKIKPEYSDTLYNLTHFPGHV